jgi:hypothetical protein
MIVHLLVRAKRAPMSHVVISPIPALSPQRIDGLTVLVDGPVEIVNAAPHRNRGLGSSTDTSGTDARIVQLVSDSNLRRR